MPTSTAYWTYFEMRLPCNASEAQGKVCSRLFSRGLRCFDHAGLGIKTCTTCHKRRKSDSEWSWSTANVEQCFIAIEAEPFSGGAKELRGIRFSIACVKLDSGGKAAH